MKSFPEPIQSFIRAFSRLPALGPRAATRLAFYIINADPNLRAELLASLSGLHTMDRCPRCFFVKQASEPLCSICANSARDKKQIAIVEKDTDLLSLEQAKTFHGQYLIFGELSKKGVMDSLHTFRIQKLKERIMKECDGMADEILIALNPNTFSDFVSGFLKEELKTVTKKITHLGRGVPTGGDIEFADEETLRHALEGRK
jgi:recombination protein RecR